MDVENKLLIEYKQSNRVLPSRTSYRTTPGTVTLTGARSTTDV